jgi:uncharacterized membrane protein
MIELENEKISSILRKDLEDALTMRKIALTASFMALVFLSTALIYIIIPSAGGFFILGETFVYISALVGGPIVGAIASGGGAAMADMALGFGSFAPGTLVIKGTEAFIVGSLYRMLKNNKKEVQLLVTGAITGFLLIFTGIFSLDKIEGEFILHTVVEKTIAFSFPGYILLIIALILSVIIWYAHLKLGEKGKMAIACLAGGTIMVIGYFIYEISVVDYTIEGAASEIPFNIAQVVFGIAIALPVVSYLKKLGVLSDDE